MILNDSYWRLAKSRQRADYLKTLTIRSRAVTSAQTINWHPGNATNPPATPVGVLLNASILSGKAIHHVKSTQWQHGQI